MDYYLLVTLSSLVMFSVFLICAILLFWKGQTKNVKPLSYASLSWGAFAIRYLLQGIAFYSLYVNFVENYSIYYILNILGSVFIVAAVLTFLVFIDTIKRESINVIKFSLVSAVGALLIYVDLFGAYIDDTIPFAAFNDIIMDLYLLFMFEFLIRSTLKAPRNLRTLSIFLCIVTITLGSLTYAFAWIYLGFGYFLTVIYGSVMNFILVIVLVRNPGLLYILPYRVHRLTVIHRKIGISIYDHQFSSSDIDEDLLAGLLNALEQMSVEVLKHGELEEIKLTQGILIFVKSEKITVGLITSKSSTHLRDSLNKFAMAFEARFNQLLDMGAPDLNEFNSAIELIDFYFGNIPSYTQIKKE